MTPLRQRMIEDMQLRGLAEATQRAYLLAVRQLAEHYDKSPDCITEEELRQYFLYLTNEKQVARGTASLALCAIKFLYEFTLKREWPTIHFVRPPKEWKLPVVLSRDEVRTLLARLRKLHHRVCLSTIYSCGLRVSEGVSLQVADVDSDRMCLRIRQSKANKDRYVPLPERTLELLRTYWVTHRNPVWIFPVCNSGGPRPRATSHMTSNSVQRAFRAALAETNIQKDATVHTLRHSYATHLLEAGVSIRRIQSYLGHRSASTTARYTHVAQKSTAQTTDALGSLEDILPSAEQV